jgi:phenylpropionate dioxygenase-like ring-hydroxylating dioxygenase large terminal subunit
MSKSSLDDPILRSQWLVVAEGSQIAEGRVLPVNALGIDIVLWRERSEIHAWRDLCIHRGSKLSLGQVRKGCLVCPYHGWQYNAAGNCVFIPAQPDRLPPLRAKAETFSVCERYGLVWIALETPQGDVPEFSAAQDPNFRSFSLGPYAFDAKGPRLIENFVDISHLPVAHERLLGDLEHANIDDYEVYPGTSDGEGPSSGDIGILQPDPDGTGRPARMSYRYKVHTPLTASLTKSFGSSQLAMLYTVTPIAENRSVGWGVIALNYARDVADETLREFQDLIVSQDKVIVESQRPELLPIDLQEELHLRSDRMAIAYRSWLKATKMNYGVA